MAVISCVFTAILMTGGVQPALAERFILADGEVIDGTIIQATKSSIAIKRAIGSLQLVRLKRIEEVQVDRPNKSPLAGRLISWTDGVYVLDVGDKIVEVRDGVVLSEAPSRPIDRATATPGGRPPDADEASSLERRADDDRAPEEKPGSNDRVRAATLLSDVSPASVDPDSQSEPEAERAPLVASATKVRPAADAPPEPEGGVTVSVLAASAREGESIRFDLRLSQPLTRSLVIAYATIGGTAKDGVDFEAQRGILTFAPGETTAELRTALVDDDTVEGEEQFDLFLSVDPALATLSERQVRATILDND